MVVFLQDWDEGEVSEALPSGAKSTEGYQKPSNLGMYTGAATMENNTEHPQKTKTRNTQSQLWVYSQRK